MKPYKFVFALIFCLNITIVLAQATREQVGGKVKTKTATLNHSTKKIKSFIVSGSVEQTSSYCGGARPSQEMLDKFATPSPYPNKKFYIRKGNKNNTKSKIIKSFTTDSTGAFSIRLAPGTYSIILEEQLHEIKASDYVTQNQQVDEKCLVDWWAKPYYLLVVKNKNIKYLNFVFHHRCFISSDIPCINYTGPLPP